MFNALFWFLTAGFGMTMFSIFVVGCYRPKPPADETDPEDQTDLADADVSDTKRAASRTRINKETAKGSE